MSVEPQQVAVVTTGGTLDKIYYDALSQYQVGVSVVGRILETARVTTPFRIVELLRKDSLDLTDADRELLRATIADLPEDRVVVTHGTDTMTQSAAVLRSIPNKTVVMTGSLTPARFADSDGPFNLGMAFAAAQCLPCGVYIAMNGRIFAADKVRKDREGARFIDID